MQSYSHTQGTRRKLVTSDSSALATQAYTPDAADHLVAGDAQHVQFVSAPMAAGITFTNADVIKFCLQCLMANGSNAQQVQLFVSIVSEDGATVRRTLRSKVLEGNTMATSLTSRFLSTTQDGASYTTVSGDRLVVEFSCSGTPTAAGGTQGHNTSMRWGGNGAGGDLAENDTQTGTTLNPWIEFVPTITFNGTSNPISVGGTITPTGALAKQTAKLPTGTVTPTGALLRETRKTPTGTIGSAGSLVKQFVRTLAGSVTPAGALARQTAKALSGSVAPAGTVNALKLVLRDVAGTLTPSGSFAPQTGKAVSGVVTSSGSLVRSTLTTVAGTITPAGTLLRQAQYTIAGSVGMAGALTAARQTLLAVAGAIVPAGTLVHRVGKTFDGVLGLAGSVLRVFPRLFGGSVGLAGDLTNESSVAAVITAPASRTHTVPGTSRSIVTPSSTRNTTTPNDSRAVRVPGRPRVIES